MTYSKKLSALCLAFVGFFGAAHGQEQTPYKDPYLSTLWGLFKMAATLGISPNVKTYLVQVPNLEVTRNPQWGLPVKVALQKSSLWGKVIKRPLIVYMPGLGAEHNGSWSRYSIPKFYHKGYHVMSLPSPMSEDFISRRHISPPGSLVEEAKTQRQVIAQVIKMIGKENISTVHWVGESYGAFVGSIMVALDVQVSKEEQILDPSSSQVLLASPPLDFKHSIERIDNDIENTRDFYESHCSRFESGADVVYHALFSQNREDQIPEDTKTCARSLVVTSGFKEKSLMAGKSFERAWGLHLSPTDPAAYAIWKLKMTVGQIFKLYNNQSDATLEDSNVRDFGYWISEIRRNSDISLSLVGTNDDFLNESESWRQNNYFTFFSDRLSLLSRGGHLGYVVTDEYRRVLDGVLPRLKR